MIRFNNIRDSFLINRIFFLIFRRFKVFWYPIQIKIFITLYKYQAQKKAAEARKKQKTFDVKEIKMRPNIDTHDYDVKMRNMRRFFEHGDKVKVTLRFRGREMAHQELGVQLLQRVRDETDEIAKVEAEPKLEGRQMVMVLAPR